MPRIRYSKIKRKAESTLKLETNRFLSYCIAIVNRAISRNFVALASLSFIRVILRIATMHVAAAERVAACSRFHICGSILFDFLYVNYKARYT